jgi:hypothetical protein
VCALSYREPAGRDVVEGLGVEDGVGGGPEGEGVGRVVGPVDGVAGGVIEGLGGIGMMTHGVSEDPEFDQRIPYRPCLSRILCSPDKVGRSPWAKGFGPVRPIWNAYELRKQPFTVRNPLYRIVSHGEIPLDRSPILDARPLSITLGTPKEIWYYTHLRGIHMRMLPHGVRLTSMVYWGPPHRHGQWVNRWTPKVMGAVWVCPDLHPHTRWTYTLDRLLADYDRWGSPIFGFDSGWVLDTRMLALMGLGIPLSPAMAARLQPYVRALSLADLPQRGPHLQPWVPGSSRRWSRTRWLALLDQFPQVPVLIPALSHPQEVPYWLQEPCRASPSPQLPESVWPPPLEAHVSLQGYPKPVSGAMRRRAQKRRYAIARWYQRRVSTVVLPPVQGERQSA